SSASSINRNRSRKVESMSRKACIAIGVLTCGASYLALAVPQNSSPINGQWTIGGPVLQDRVQLTIQRNSGSSHMSSSSYAQLGQLRGLTAAQLESAGSLAKFELARDAGTYRLDRKSTRLNSSHT